MSRFTSIPGPLRSGGTLAAMPVLDLRISLDAVLAGVPHSDAIDRR